MEQDNKEEIIQYGDEAIASKDAKIPGWLSFSYLFWVLWGILWWILFWNGSAVPWFDPGGWLQLQKAANTTFPSENHNDKDSR